MLGKKTDPTRLSSRRWLLLENEALLEKLAIANKKILQMRSATARKKVEEKYHQARQEALRQWEAISR